MKNQPLVDIPLLTQLFPAATLLEEKGIGPVKQSLQFITVPTFTGKDIYQVMLHNQKLLDSTVAFAHSSDRFPYENAIKGSIPDVIRLSSIVDHYKMAMLGYPGQMELGFLEWRKTGSVLPAFMVLDLNSRSFTMKVTISKKDRYRSDLENEIIELEITPNLPQEMFDHYSVFAKPLAKMIRSSLVKKETIFITSMNTGSPPRSTTLKIQKAISSKLFKRIYVIADAAEWVEDREVEVWPDPIVIGERNIFHNMYGHLKTAFYFIDIYNPTTFEKLAVESYQKLIPPNLLSSLPR